MSDPRRTEESRLESDMGQLVEGSGTAGSPKSPPDSAVEVSNATAPATSKKLTADEQMALYEKELKENDWGHQPC